MPKQLNVNLAFTADTAKASQGIKSLQQQLTQLMNTAVLNSSSLGLTKDIKEATTAAAQLKAQLSSAMNANGTLDLTKFNDSLKASGMTLEQYRVKLSALGPEGTQAFSALASQISSAEIPLRRANTLLQEMGTTLMNTARWQLSSSLLHGFIGGLQHAYGYAQDLNESLNNIRIVTGQSTEQMAQFADKANKAAKELSIGTNEYAKSALIFYQQGLNDKQVEERNRTVAKLTNVTRQSAEEVSSQMTAIWNNFDNGTKSLEYYADAITALGAKTASSSSEIAEGLSKFAAVADTIGLSYETATASLATVVAETRQSADTVGNAFKSIFSRLQSLKLGETLEDGVGLTKYSEALEKVGVQVLDINGELRTADDIMSDLGDRWTEISDTQKTALAQTVAGQRQYAQFVALFDNWDKVQSNIGIAEGSEGTLQEQADIYAESWEASSKRVQASAEAIYNALINDKFFIGFNDLISGVLDRVNGLIKGLGGLPGVLTIVGALLTKVFSSQIASNIQRITDNITKASIKGAQQQQQNAIIGLQKQAQIAEKSGSAQGSAQANNLREQASLQETLIKNQERYNAEQLKTAQNLLDENAHLREVARSQGEVVDKERQKSELLKQNEIAKAQRYADRNGIVITDDELQKLRQSISEFEQLQNASAETRSSLDSFYQAIGDKSLSTNEKISQIGTIWENNMKQIKQSLSDSGIGQGKINFIERTIDALKAGQISIDQFKGELDKVFLELNKNTSGADLAKQFFNFYQDADLAGEAVDRLAEQFGLTAEEAKKLKEDIQAVSNSAKNGRDAMNEMKTATATFGQQVQAVSSFAMSFASVINSVKSAIDILNNEDLSFGEKMLQIIPSLLMSFGMLTSAMSGASGAALITAASHIPLIGSFASEAVAANLATASTATFGVTLKAVFPILGIITGGILAIGAALKAWDDTHYSFAEKMEDAKAATEHAAEAAEHAKTKYEEISSAVDQYQSVIDTLDSCTVGTDAWREALEKVGEVTQDLIDQYPELLDYYDSATGQLNLGEMQKHLELLEQQKLATSLQNIYAPTREERVKQQNAEDVWDKVQGDFQQQNVDLASVSGGNIKFGDENPVLSYLEQMQKDAMQKISSGESTEKAWDVASQNGQNYQLSLTAQEYTDLFNNAVQGLQDSGVEITRDNYLELLTEQFKKDPDLVNQINGIINAELENLEYLNENDEYVENFSADLLNQMNPDAHQAIFDSLLQSIISNFTTQSNYFIESAEAAQSYEGTLNTAMSRIVNARLSSLADESTYDSLTKALVEKTLKDTIQKQSEYIDENKQENFDEQYKGKMDFTGQTVSLRAQDAYYMKGTEGANGNDYEAWQKGFTDAYLQASGLSNLQYSHVEGNNDEDRKYVFKDTENEGKEVSIDVEEMSSVIALYENGIVNFTDILDKAGQKVDEVFGSDLPDDLKDALGKGFQEGKFSFSDVAKESLDAIFTDGKASSLTDRIIESLGLKDAPLEDINNKFLELFDISYTDLLNGLSSGLNKFNQGLESLGQDIKSESTRESFNSILGNLEGTSLNTQGAAKDQLKAAYVGGGDEATQALANLYAEAGENAAKLTELDFSSFDSLEDFKEGLKEVGLESLASSEGLDLVFNSLKQLEEPSQTASQRIAEVNKITGSLSKGGTISEEDYSILGTEITEGFFRKVADGTYELIKDADEFQSHVDKISLEKLGEEIRNRNAVEKSITERYESGDEIKGYADSSYKVDESGEYIAGSQDAGILREQIDFLAEIGKLTDEQIWELGQDLDHNQKLSLDNLELVHGLMLEIASDWDSINQKVENNEQLTEDDITQLLSLTPNLESLEKFYNNNKDLFEGIDFSKLNIEGIDLEGLDGLEALAKIFVEGGFADTSGIKTLDEYKKALKGIGEQAGLTTEQAKEAWKNIDPSTLKMSDLSFIKNEFKAGRMEAEEFKKSISVLTEKASSLSELHKLLNDATAEDYSSALQRVLNQSGTGTKKALDEIDQAILNGKADAELLGTILDRIMGASDLTSLEKAQELNDRQYSEEERIDEHSGQKVTVTKQNYTDKEKGFKQIDLAKNSDDLFDTQRLDLYNQGIANIGNTSKLTASEVRQIGEAAISIYKDSNLFDIDQQIKGIGDAFKIANGEIDPANLKIYADAIRDIVLNANDLTLDKKIELIKEKLTEAGVPAEYLNQQIAELILNTDELDTLEEKIQAIIEALGEDEALKFFNNHTKELLNLDRGTTIEQIEQLNNLLARGYIKAKSYGETLLEILNNSGEDIERQQARLEHSMIATNKSEISEAPQAPQKSNKTEQDYWEEKGSEEKGSEAYQADLEKYKADLEAYNIAMAKYDESVEKFEAYKRTYEEFLDTVQGSDFSNLDSLLRVFDDIPEGIEGLENAKRVLAEYAESIGADKDLIENYNYAVEQGNQEAIALNEAQLLLTTRAQEVANAYDLETESVKNVAQEYLSLANVEGSEYEYMKDRYDLAIAQAQADLRATRGLEGLTENYDKNLEALKALNEAQAQNSRAAVENFKNNSKYSTTYKKMQEDLADLVDINKDLMKNSWMDDLLNSKSPEKLQKLLQGDAKEMAAFKNEVADMEGMELGFDQGSIDELQAQIDSLNAGDVITPEMDTSGILSALQEMYDAGVISGEQLETFLGTLNLTPNFSDIPEAAAEAVAGAEGELSGLTDAAAAEGSAAGSAYSGGFVQDSAIEASTEQAEFTNSGSIEQAAFEEVTHVSWERPTAEVLETNGKDKKSVQLAIPAISQDVNPKAVDQEVSNTTPVQRPKFESATVKDPGKISAPKSSGGGHGGGKGGCFVAGTPVTIGNTYKNIEDIKIGDIVLSYNEKLKRNEYSVVLQTMIHHVYDNIYTLYIEDEKLVVTGIHRFLINDGIYMRWIAAENLREGDFVLFADGTLHTINKIDVELKSEIVYNFEVSNNHNYYVGKNQILAHNKSRKTGGGGRNTVRTTTKRASAEHEDNRERYRPVVQQLEKLNKAYEDVGKAQEVSFGAKHQKNLQKTIELQDKIIKKQKEYKAEIDKYVDIDTNSVNNQSKKTIVTGYENKPKNADKAKIKIEKDNKKYFKQKFQDVGSSNVKSEGNAAFNYTDIKLKGNNQRNIETTKYVSADFKSAVSKNTINKLKKDENIDVSGGADIDKGVITNYNDLVYAADTDFNKFADYYAKNYDENLKYDPKKKNKEAVLRNNALKNEYEKRKAIHDQFLENLKQLEESLKLQAEQITAAIENEITQIQNRIAEATYTVDLKLDINDQDMKLLDYTINKLSDHARDAAAYITKVGEQMKSVNESMKTNAEGIANIIKTVVNNDKKNLKEIIDNNGETQYFNQDNLEDSSAFLNGDELLKQLESSDEEEQKKAIDTLVKAKALKTPQIEEMRDRAQNQLDMAQQLKDYYWSIFDRMESALDEWDTNMDTIIDKQTHLNTLLNGYKNVIDLIGKTQFYQDRAKGRDLEAKIDASLQTQANETIKTYQKMRDNNRAFLEDQGVKGQEGYQEGLYTKRADAKAKMEDMSLSEDVRNEWAKTYDRYNEMVLEREQKSREIQENIEASFEEALQRNVDAWQNSMERITEEFQESLANNAVTLDYLADALDRYTKTHSTMVAEYEKVHQLRQMDLEAEKSINEATNPKIKRELLEIQEEISAATSHETKMSEYELTYLRQKLELKQAEAAMDDAKKAKTQVSLTRDNEGNFGYVYTADEGDVADAEKNYADKIYEMQKANAEYIQDLQTQIVTAEQEYYQKIQEITNDTSLSDKQRKAKLAQVHADYDTLHKALTDQLTFALNAGVDVYGKYSERYAEITGDITATNLAHVEDFSETQLALQTGYLDLGEYAKNWEEKSKAYYVDMGKTLDAYTEATKTTTAIYNEQTDSSKNATEEYANALEKELGKVSSKTTDFTKEMSTLGDTSSTAFGKILTEAGKLEKSYVGYMDNMIKRTENLVSALIKVQTELSKTNPDDFNNGNGSNGGGPGPGPGPGSGSGSGSGPSGKQNKLDIGKKYSKGKKKGQFVTGKGHTKKITSKNVRRVRLTRAQKKYVLKAARKQGIKAKKAKTALKELLNNYKKVVIHFDTGGYTGNWSGDNGKLAMLHQKEMVLNQKDTSNILSAVDMIRGISEKIDLNALAQSGALSSGLASGINGVTNNTLEQNVHITAEFPNATDRNEITEAFNNIIGLAAQYANR